MIKANEIRIGNIYNRKVGKGITPIIIDEMIMAEIFGQSLEYSLNDLEPIKLTKEELKAMGFEEYPHNHDFAKDGIYISHITSDESYQLEFTSPLIEWMVIDLKFVHQLQNIYFTLTGKELKPFKL